MGTTDLGVVDWPRFALLVSQLEYGWPLDLLSDDERELIARGLRTADARGEKDFADQLRTLLAGE